MNIVAHWRGTSQTVPKLATLDYCKLPILTASTLIKTLNLESKLKSIEKFTAVGNTYFRSLYLPAILQYCEAAQLAPASAAHHHAGPGGHLTHTLDVIDLALRIRKSYNLPQYSTPETIYQQEHVWTYAVFVGALLHDIGKLVSNTRIILDTGLIWNPHLGSACQAGAKYYKVEFCKSPYKQHSQIAGTFFHLIPDKGRGWLAQYPEVLAQLSTWLYGDHYEYGAIGEIVRQADRKSVANNLQNGGDRQRFPNSPSVPMVDRLMTALRELLDEGVLTINRPDGSAGWCDNQYTYLVCGTTANLVRQRLNETGATDIPTSNNRIFDILQEHGYVISTSNNGSIWKITINDKLSLTVLKFETNRLFHPSHRPQPFSGSLLITENTDQVSDQVNVPAISAPDSAECYVTKESAGADARDHTNDAKMVVSNQVTSIPKYIFPESQVNEEMNTVSAPVDNSAVPKAFALQDPDIAHYFLDWIRQGLRDGKITINRTTALIHIVKEGVLVVTPLAFRKFARRYEFLMDNENNEDDVVKRVQSRLVKVMTTAKLHRKTAKGLNIHTYKINGPNKESIIRGWLLPTLAIFGDKKPPNINSALENLSGFSEIKSQEQKS